MKNYQLLFIVMLFFLAACNSDPIKVTTCEDCNFTCVDSNQLNIFTNSCRDNWECTFEVMNGSTVDLDQTFGISNGNKTVFKVEMVRTSVEPYVISDYESTNILVFELDEPQNSFSVEDSELSNMRIHYRNICYCADITFKPITLGCLQGEKQIDGSWFVQGYFEDSFDFGLDAQFVK
jgi:hypothetical protein